MIWCVEDDAGIRELIVYTLESLGYEAAGFEDGKSFFEALAGGDVPELVILDVMLPGEDGIAVLKRLRKSEKTAHIPVIIASAKGTEADKVKGLDSGADDYLAKPFGMMEMVSRVKAVLRRVNRQPDDKPEILVAGAIRLSVAEHSVCAGGNKIVLTAKEFALLQYLMEHPGRVFSRGNLIERVWGVDFVGDERTVDVHVATLRTKLGEHGSIIKTVRSFGYKLDMAND